MRCRPGAGAYCPLGGHETHSLTPSRVSRRHLVGLAGSPGSGKTTTAAQVVARANALAVADVAAVLPMDGFHLYRSQLDALPDPREAHRLRGAC